MKKVNQKSISLDRPCLLGAGLGLRRNFLDELLALPLDSPNLPDFLEIAPENWIGFEGVHAKKLAQIAERFPLVCHGLSLSIGGLQPIDPVFIQQIKRFLKQYRITVYSEHLSYTHDGVGFLYDLLPIPMTEDAVDYVAKRILYVQELLGQRLVIENTSTYLMPDAEMTEAEFMCRVLKQADCEILLDVNNVYVNAFNHQPKTKQQRKTAYQFIDAIPADKIRYLHLAGHEKIQLSDQSSLLLDTHGEAVIPDVWDLLAYTYRTKGVKPTLLERDFNLPDLTTLLTDVAEIRQCQQTISS